MTATHKAMVRQHGTVSVLTQATPSPAGYELLVKPLYAGLCGTDIQMLRGLRADPSPIIGHEGIARVIAAGERVPDEVGVGTLVCINPTHRNDPSFLLGHNVKGLLQERVLIQESAVRDGLVIPLGEHHNSVLSTLLEPLAAVHYAFSLLADHHPRTLVVFGDGVIGHLAIRAAAALLGSDIRIVHLHHTEQGVAWSKQHRVAAVRPVLNNAAGAALLSSLPEDERVGVLLATPRDATLACLNTALCCLRGDTTIDLLGGLPSDASAPLLPSVDLASIRAANCGGAPNPGVSFTVQTSTGKSVQLTGHRGVAHRHLRHAAAELARHPLRYSDLVTHVLPMNDAAAVMNQLAGSRERLVAGRRLIKLAVHISPDNLTQE
ncbi:alcohol dehydrogenase [Chimaeribacter arupi]|uniref:Alcohol dehydrogenase n=2 Tax=Yersiniaceae TaxID=1903411 RepID=A0A2N5ENF1_9GAMM|nr:MULTISPECIES: alcohol dehydrogenase catalytic domain-containing protein [Yersiniaceae]MBS0969453.1 alcohol dehydrogenase catalytic domain-containing protein [Nissabacter archeti]MDV5140236.1 alcohol dehydrogenase catalytic domain-containing protein [Chimaeribacter arupi]PLR30112.1 alcohol dehydrogenase [Chimaeribacter arupi]PLR47544.1 alcohol dehydrogenase [Chimaeribacter arupi]PLR50213.1 alcohol dehydrogenase [Chimaeribacter arupi]